MRVVIEYIVGNKPPIAVDVDEQDYDSLLDIASLAGCLLMTDVEPTRYKESVNRKPTLLESIVIGLHTD